MASRHVKSLRRISGSVVVPGDKSYSHRAVMLSALAAGESHIYGLSGGDDVKSTIGALCSLGAIVDHGSDYVIVSGPSDGLRPTNHEIDCGNSGTSIRLLAGLTGGIEGDTLLTGDQSLCRRPMDRVAVPLRMMNIKVEGNGSQVLPPLRVTGTAMTKAIDYTVPQASAQVKSSIMFAALWADGASTVFESTRTRQTTEEMMRLCGIDVDVKEVGAGREVIIHPGRPRAREWYVPGDPSQAAFFVVLGLIHDEANISLADVEGSNERVGFINVLQRMGGNIQISAHKSSIGISVTSSELLATEIAADEIPSVDEVPVLVVAAAAATGTTVFRGMAELRIKESDRFENSVALARALGATAAVNGDDFAITGVGSAKNFNSFDFDGHLDHRMVMAAAVGGAAANGCDIDNWETVSTSFPGFFDVLNGLETQ